MPLVGTRSSPLLCSSPPAAARRSRRRPTPQERTAATSSAIGAAYQYSACMRRHGVTNFQDPQVSTQRKSGPDRDPRGPRDHRGSRLQVRTASLCAHPAGTPSNASQPGTDPRPHRRDPGLRQVHAPARLPQRSRTRTARASSPRRCSAPGIDLQQPAIKPAAYACLPLTHGILTRPTSTRRSRTRTAALRARPRAARAEPGGSWRRRRSCSRAGSVWPPVPKLPSATPWVASVKPR